MANTYCPTVGLALHLQLESSSVEISERPGESTDLALLQLKQYLWSSPKLSEDCQEAHCLGSLVSEGIGGELDAYLRSEGEGA